MNNWKLFEAENLREVISPHLGIVRTLANADEYELPIIKPTISTEKKKIMIEA